MAIIKAVLTVLAFYLLYCILLFISQRKIIFPISGIVYPPSKQLSGIETVWLETDEGKIEAWFMPPVTLGGNGLSPAVIFAHGNAELIDHCPEFLSPFPYLGIGVLLVEYPGYGRSKGTPSQVSITKVFVAAYDKLASKETIDTSRIILYGRSVGGGVVCALAARRPSAALILMSTFQSVRSFAIRYGAPSLLIRDPFDNLSVVRSYKNPILIIHGKDDTIIPPSHSEALHKAAPHSKLIMYDCGHNDCPLDDDIFWNDIESFLHESGII